MIDAWIDDDGFFRAAAIVEGADRRKDATRVKERGVVDR